MANTVTVAINEVENTRRHACIMGGVSNQEVFARKWLSHKEEKAASKQLAARPASCTNSAKSKEESGESSDGLSTHVQPASKAGMAFKVICLTSLQWVLVCTTESHNEPDS
jgi:hypothetical protein